MFRLSQKADYGLILLSALAHPRGEKASDQNTSKVGSPRGFTPRGSDSFEVKRSFVSVSSVAKKNKISPKFLSQIAQDLKKAGIITSREGVSGGYTLARNAGEIKLLDVLKVLDGELVSGKCFEDDHECVCGAGEMWKEMREQLEATIGSKTVADLVI